MKTLISFKRTLVLICIFVLIPLFILCMGVDAATIYVDPDCTNGITTYNPSSHTCTGGSYKVYSHPQNAVNVMNPGDIIIITDGTYTDTNMDNHVIRTNRAGTSDKWITIKSENKWGAILDGTNAGTGIDVGEHSEYIRFEDIEIRNVCTAGSNCNADGVKIEVETDPPDPQSSYCGTSGYDAGHHIYFYRLKIHDINRHESNSSGGQAGIDGSPCTHDITIDSCFFYNIGRLNPYTTPSATQASCTYGSEVRCYNNDAVIYWRSTNSNYLIINNIVETPKSGWGMQPWDKVGPVTHAKVINNTFYGTNNPYVEGSIALWGRMQDWIIQNNIFYSPRNVAVATDTISNDSNIIIRNNLVYGASIADSCSGSWTCSSNITGQDPKFVDQASRNFRLQSNSPAINKGLSFTGRTKDADGNSIVGVPDIGAYEAGNTDTIPPAPPAVIEVK